MEELTGAAPALANLLTSSALALGGFFAFAAAVRRPRTSVLPAVFLCLCAAGLEALAADEGLELHDRAGRWLWREHGIAAPPPINHIDDLFVLAYTAAGFALIAAYARTLLRHRSFLSALAAAGALFATAAIFDALGDPEGWTNVPEETLEVLGAALIFVTFWRESRDVTSFSVPGMQAHRQPADITPG